MSAAASSTSPRPSHNAASLAPIRSTEAQSNGSIRQSPKPEEIETIVRMIGAAQPNAKIAEALGWPLPRTLSTIKNLRKRRNLPSRVGGQVGARAFTHADVTELRRLHAEGLTFEAIGLAMGRTKASVALKALKIGLRRQARDDWEELNTTALVPAWVPLSLREEYEAVLLEEGEFAAAAWARAEKRQMRMAA